MATRQGTRPRARANTPRRPNVGTFRNKCSPATRLLRSFSHPRRARGGPRVHKSSGRYRNAACVNRMPSRKPPRGRKLDSAMPQQRPLPRRRDRSKSKRLASPPRRERARPSPIATSSEQRAPSETMRAPRSSSRRPRARIPEPNCPAPAAHWDR